MKWTYFRSEVCSLTQVWTEGLLNCDAFAACCSYSSTFEVQRAFIDAQLRCFGLWCIQLLLYILKSPKTVMHSLTALCTDVLSKRYNPCIDLLRCFEVWHILLWVMSCDAFTHRFTGEALSSNLLSCFCLYWSASEVRCICWLFWALQSLNDNQIHQTVAGSEEPLNHDAFTYFWA